MIPKSRVVAVAVIAAMNFSSPLNAGTEDYLFEAFSPRDGDGERERLRRTVSPNRGEICALRAISWHFERDPIPYALETDWWLGGGI